MFVESLDHPECVTRGPDGMTYAGGEAAGRSEITRASGARLSNREDPGRASEID